MRLALGRVRRAHPCLGAPSRLNSPDRLSEASRRLRPVWPLLLLVIAVAACRGAGDSDAPTPTAIVSRSADPIKVVVTLPVFADFVREIGGQNVEVASLIPEGVDPHTYEPRPEDANLVADADIILVNGLGLEEPALEFIAEHRASGLTNLVTIAANVPSPTAEQPVDKPVFATEAGDDPHLWLDPKLARIYPETVADSLNIVDGKNGDYYEATFRAYLEQLQELDREIAQTIEAIPPEGRKLVTYHSSLVHFARRYGLDVVGVVNEDTTRNTPPGKVKQVTRLAQQEGVRAFFSEVGFDSLAIEEAAAEAGLSVCTLYTDSLDEEAATYLEMMRANTRELGRCLGNINE